MNSAFALSGKTEHLYGAITGGRLIYLKKKKNKVNIMNSVNSSPSNLTNSLNKFKHALDEYKKAE